MRKPIVTTAVVAVAVLSSRASASAHARMSPSVSLANELQLYSLAIPTEKANAYTTKIVLTLPKGFSIDSFVPNRAGSGSSSRQDRATTQ